MSAKSYGFSVTLFSRCHALIVTKITSVTIDEHLDLNIFKLIFVISEQPKQLISGDSITEGACHAKIVTNCSFLEILLPKKPVTLKS